MAGYTQKFLIAMIVLPAPFQLKLLLNQCLLVLLLVGYIADKRDKEPLITDLDCRYTQAYWKLS